MFAIICESKEKIYPLSLCYMLDVGIYETMEFKVKLLFSAFSIFIGLYGQSKFFIIEWHKMTFHIHVLVMDCVLDVYM